MEELNQEILKNFKRYIKNIESNAPAKWISLKKNYKTKDSNVVVIQYIKALRDAVKKLNINVDYVFDNNLDDDRECIQ